MAFVKKTWKDRISEYPNRRTINDGFVTKQVTVGRDEGNITEEGDPFNASNMNDLEDRIEEAIQGASDVYTGGDNIAIVSNAVNVTGFMTAAEAHTIWNNA
jgi:hypothetical protein